MLRPLGSQGCGCPWHRGPREAPPGKPGAVRAACCASDCPKSLWVLWEQGQSLSPGWAQSPNCRVNAGHQDTCPVLGPLPSGCVLPKRPRGSVRRLRFQPPETARDASGGLPDPSVPPLGDFLLLLLQGAGEAGLPLGPCNPGQFPSTARAGRERGTCRVGRRSGSRWGGGRARLGGARPKRQSALPALRCGPSQPSAPRSPVLPDRWASWGGLRAVSPRLPHRQTSGSAQSRSPSQQDPQHLPRGASIPSALASRSG